MSTASVPAVSNDVPVPAAQRQLTIRDQLRNPVMIEQIRMVLPTHMKPERMVRIALTAITRTPDLASCDQASFFRCLLDLSQWGLEPDGRHAYLIPRENRKRNCLECTLQIDYKGYVQLAYRSGFVKNIHADVVHKGDIFKYSRGQVVDHVPWFLRTDENKPEKQGDVIAAYSYVQLKDGAEKSEAMSVDEIEGIRKRSPAGKSGPWVTDTNEMRKKTVFRRVSKWIPLSAEVVEAFERDDDRFEDLHTPDRVVQSKDLDELASRLMGPKQGAIGQHDGIDDEPADDGHQGEHTGDGPQLSETELDALARKEAAGER